MQNPQVLDELKENKSNKNFIKTKSTNIENIQSP